MLVQGEGFPYTPLEDPGRQWVITLCGGNPLAQEYVRKFLATSGLPTVGGALERSFFDDVSWRSVNALDMHGAENARACNRGLLFYAGVLREVNGVAVIPYENQVMAAIGDADGRDFALESYQRIRDEVPSFCALIESEARQAIGAEDDQLYQLVLVGAGALHYAVVESLARMSDTDVMGAAHPELADLEDIFRQMGEQ